ncbi:hypothetical protein C8K30_102350 [Promicromonospora sp. AC04]|uniref:DUF308 domain-containing protein n=1 Tax=Promicromonospora sp. AC04 TaxID=2135723 RepID=UPI000D38F952|nr:DUF308 domain-containing protein [Promicromonospora sp. AC04]PUB29972.1 hypothetical protein C8K30_102350 [Promicromonospora sp. AC04]
MTENKNDRENQSEIPGRPEGQDTSEDMDHKTTEDPDTTEVLPAQATPPTQKIALDATPQTPESPAPEGEVHPAYGVAAARVEAEAEAATVHDAPAADDTDLLAPLRDPVPQVPATPAATTPASGSGPDPAQPTLTQPAQPAQPGQQATQVAPKRGPRVGTAVWGLIVIAVGLGILAIAAGVVFDLGAALIVLLGAAGVILVVGSVVSSFKRR